MNLAGVEVLNPVQVFYSTSCQYIHGILAVNVFVHISFVFDARASL